MDAWDESMREILEGLNGLVTLNEWELTLVRNLRQKTEAVIGLRDRERGSDPADGPPTESE